ncbi:MAG: ATP-binding protein, partial [Vulcanimicrobiaceae bacterium]
MKRGERVAVALFGNARFCLPGAPRAYRAPAKTFVLLAYLALSPQPLSRVAVAAALWPDESEPRGRANVRRYLYHLHRLLPEAPERPWLLEDQHTIGWNHAAGTTDVERYRRLLSDDATLAQAVELYRGDLLADWYDDWVVGPRERLRAQQSEALWRLAVSRRAHRDLAAALAYARRFVEFEPWREDALRLQMMLHADAGDRAGALRAYDEFKQRLNADMELAPLPETAALAERLRQEEAPRVRAERTPLVAREREREALETAWTRAARGFGGIVFVSGEAGIGKSRLVADACAWACVQGAIVHEGATRRPESAPYEALTNALGTRPMVALGAHEPLEVPFARLLAEHTRGAPAVLVLEDMHWAGQTSVDLLEALAPTIATLPLLVLATFREGETTQGHPLRAARRRLLARGLAQSLPLGRLGADDVARLCAEYVPQPRRALDATSAYRITEGNPLFVVELLRNADDGHMPAPTAGMQATLRERIERLSPPVLACARAAAVVGDAFDVDLLCALGGWSEADTLVNLEALLERRVVREVDGRHSRYAFTHHLLAASAYAGLEPTQRRRLHLRAAAGLTAREEVAPERAATVARHYRLGGELEGAARYAAIAARHAYALLANTEARALAAEALADAKDPHVRHDLLEVIADVDRRCGKHPALRRDLAALEKSAEALDDDALRVDVLCRQFSLARLGADRAQAVALLERLRSFAGLSNYFLAAARQREGGLALDAADLSGASAALAQALEDALAGERAEAALRVLEDVMECDGRRAEADALRERMTLACELAAAVGTPYARGLALRAVTRAYADLYEYEAMSHAADELLALACEIGDRELEAIAHQRRAHAAAWRYDGIALQRSVAAALEISRALNKPIGVANVLRNAAILAAESGLRDDASRLLSEAREATRGVSFPLGAACNDLIAARAELLASSPVAAAAHYGAASA